MSHLRRLGPRGLAVAYAVLAALTIVFAALSPGDNGMNGILAVVFTAPWSFIGVLILDAIDPTLIDRWGRWTLGIGVGLNATLLYLFLARRTSRLSA